MLGLIAALSLIFIMLVYFVQQRYNSLRSSSSTPTTTLSASSLEFYTADKDFNIIRRLDIMNNGNNNTVVIIDLQEKYLVVKRLDKSIVQFVYRMNSEENIIISNSSSSNSSNNSWYIIPFITDYIYLPLYGNDR